MQWWKEIKIYGKQDLPSSSIGFTYTFFLQGKTIYFQHWPGVIYRFSQAWKLSCWVRLFTARLGKPRISKKIWSEFRIFVVRFSVYCLAFCFEFWILSKYTKQKQWKTFTRKIIIRLTFNPGLALTVFWTTRPCLQVNLTWVHIIQSKIITWSISCKLESVVWSHDTGQQLPYFDRCQYWPEHEGPLLKKDAINQGCNICLCQTINWSIATMLGNFIIVHTHEQY